MNKLAFILTAENLNDQERVGVAYYKNQNIEAAFEFEIEDTQEGIVELETRTSEITGFIPKSITFHGKYFANINQDDVIYIYSISVNKLDSSIKKDEFDAKDDTAVRWMTPQSAAELSDWRVPLTIMKILTNKTTQIIVDTE